MTAELCYGCRTPKNIAYIHPETGQGFCLSCSRGMPINPMEWALLMFTTPGSPVGPPFLPDDVVECRRAATVYEGMGVVREISMDLDHGGGTPLHPMFLVELTEKADDEVPDEAWYCEKSLTRVREAVTSS